MPRPKKPTLSYLHHKPKNLAYVRLPDGNGGRKIVYLGEYNSPESRVEHARLLAKMATAPTPEAALRLATSKTTDDVTINEIIVGFMEHAQQHYRRADGTMTDEVDQCKQTLRLFKKLYGDTLAAEFGPKDLKTVRQAMVDANWSRKTINGRVGRIRRMFRWAASEEMIPASVHQGLSTVTGLQAGRTEARETEPVGPVPMEHVLPVLLCLRPAVAAMVEVQLLSGMRPGEVCQLRPCDIDRSGAVWLYRPEQYKSKHKGKSRVVVIGPKAQAILTKLNPPEPTGYYFSPRRVVAELRAELSAKRKTPRYPSHLKRNQTKRLAAPKRAAGEKYRVKVYEHTIAKAIEKANRPRIEAGG